MLQSDKVKIEPKGYHKLKVVSELKKLIKLVYKATDSFPKNELYGITSQIRRAIVSVLLNTVEGQRRKSNKEFFRFLEIADGSLVEAEVCLELSLELNYLTKKEFDQLEDQRKIVAYMLVALKKKVGQTL